MHRNQKGVALIVVMFIIVVLAAAGVFMMRITQSASANANQVLLSSKATLAAQTGLEWGVYQALQTGDCTNTSSAGFVAEKFEEFTISVNCSVNNYTSGIDIFEISANAEYGTDPAIADYAWRKLTVTIEQ